MPFFPHHKNRSKQALNDPPVPGSISPNSGSASPRASSQVQIGQNYTPNPNSNNAGEDEARTTQHHGQAFQQSRSDQSQQQQTYANQGIVPDTDRRAYRNSDVPPHPTRSQSTRNSVGSAYQQQQQQQLQQQQGIHTGSVDDLVVESRNGSRREQAVPVQPPPPPEKAKSKSIFDRMRSSNRSEHKATPPQAYNNNNNNNNSPGLGRRLSRRADNPPAIRTPQPPTAEQQQRLDWQAAQDSRTHLPSPQEDDDFDDNVDPYLIRPGQEDIHSAPPSAIQEHNLQHTIRPVQSNSDESDYDNEGQPLPPAPPPHLHQPGRHQQSDSNSSSHYQHQHHQGLPQQQEPQQPGLLVTVDPYRQQNPDNVSQLSYDSPVADLREEQQRPPSQPTGQSPTTYPQPRQEQVPWSSSLQSPRPTSQYSANMPPQTAGSQPTRRPADTKQMQGSQVQPENRPENRSENRDAQPPNYSRQGFAGNSNQQPPTPSLPTGGSQGPGYRGGPPQREQFGTSGGGEQGRNTPPPLASGERSVEENYKELLVKYKKVKGLYFDKTAQVEQLQNTLANQRLSQSRTSLDDSEYMTRFQRLDGAIVNLAFNIRKDWQSIPPWLLPSCNQDATKIGKQEMTGVGRACITKFLMDEIFNRSFHPALDVQLSIELKKIERNIRRNSPPLNNQEESDALTSKIVNWRLATLEGLKEQLSSAEAQENKAQFSQLCTSKLCATLITYLHETPGGMQDTAASIVELAVSIASNMPLESRDINILLPMPGDLVQPNTMKIEGGIPPLTNLGETSEADASSTGSAEKDEKENEKSEGGKLRKEKPKHGGVLAGLMGGNSSSSGKKPIALPTETSSEGKNKLTAEDGVQRVRFAGFVAVEVRGRQMLNKAPVWTI